MCFFCHSDDVVVVVVVVVGVVVVDVEIMLAMMICVGVGVGFEIVLVMRFNVVVGDKLATVDDVGKNFDSISC